MIARPIPGETTEAQPTHSVALLRSLLHSLECPAFIVAHPGRTIEWANPVVEMVFGYPPKDLVGRSTEVLHVDSDSFAEFGVTSRGLVESGVPFRNRYWMRRRDGSRFASEHLVTPVNDIAGREFVVSLVSDITGSVDKHLGERLQRLSAREREVYDLTLAGLSVAEIARRLDLSHRTVEVHRANVLKKMEASSTQKLMAEVLAKAVVEKALV